MIKVTDLAYVRFTVPDLDKTEFFLVDFGLKCSERTDGDQINGERPHPSNH
jgi:hypothetical protein